MIERKNITWDLARNGDGHVLNLYWSEPHPFAAKWVNQHLAIQAPDGPWLPWQIDGAVAALRSGADLTEVDAPVFPPDTPLLRRVLGLAGDAIVRVIDRATIARSITGGVR